MLGRLKLNVVNLSKKVNEFEIPRSRAEKALLENDKDVVKTMHALIGLGAQ